MNILDFYRCVAVSNTLKRTSCGVCLHTFGNCALPTGKYVHTKLNPAANKLNNKIGKKKNRVKTLCTSLYVPVCNNIEGRRSEKTNLEGSIDHGYTRAMDGEI